MTNIQFRNGKNDIVLLQPQPPPPPPPPPHTHTHTEGDCIRHYLNKTSPKAQTAIVLYLSNIYQRGGGGGGGGGGRGTKTQHTHTYTHTHREENQRNINTSHITKWIKSRLHEVRLCVLEGRHLALFTLWSHYSSQSRGEEA